MTRRKALVTLEVEALRLRREQRLSTNEIHAALDGAVDRSTVTRWLRSEPLSAEERNRKCRAAHTRRMTANAEKVAAWNASRHIVQRLVGTRHWTKDKGDQGLGFVIADLLSHGFKVATLLTEHLPFDCIAIAPDGKTLRRVSVKYRTQRKGVIQVDMDSAWSDRNGTHRRKWRSDDCDVVAVFCPDTRECYYVRSEEVKPRMKLRLDPPLNNMQHGITWATEFRDPSRMLKAGEKSSDQR